MGKGKRNNGILPAGEVATFCRQMSLIMEAGIPIYDGIESLVESVEDDKAREAFLDIEEVIKKTGSLYKAVEEVGFFPGYMVNMIRIGEETGKLDDILKSLSVYYEREDRTKKTIKSAVSYPIILVCMMSAVILVLVTKVMPIFEDIFLNLGTNMSKTGAGIMNLGFVIGNVALIIIAVVLLVIIAAVVLKKMGKQNTLLKIARVVPGVKKLGRNMASGKFAEVMGMMLSSGYSLEKALELAPDIVEDEDVKAKIQECGKLVKEGVSFPDALSKIDMFTKMQSRIVSVGFKAGRLDSVMEKISAEYDEAVEDGIDKTVGYIEPCLVAVLSLVIGGILISVMLPLATIMSSIG